MTRTASASAVTTASPEQVFRHLAEAGAWPVWMRVPTRSRRARSGAPDPDGVGAVRAIFPMRERVVAYEPPAHYAYVMETPMPIRDYRADVRLTPLDGGGTRIDWEARGGAVVPGTGALVGRTLGLLTRWLSGSLAEHASACGGKCPVR
ncbi:SRPBCC family protein [Actinocorallia populi]|uniref:SRPBCC family protein n=1 Tax=Actinocorallia populi TaxID=2079200 RepID=UPI000D08DDD0|nr:SRPBCC family protein [Actinocorallia populi]